MHKLRSGWGIWMLVCFWGATQMLSAQQPTAASSTSQLANIFPNKPSEPLLFTFALTPELSETDADTLPDSRFRQYDPARRKPIDYANLGNLGTSAQPLFWESRPRRGFDTGIHPFDLYHIRPQDLRFYRNVESYSDAAYSQGRTQQDGNFNLQFARTFAKGFNFSLDYRSINNLGGYRYQRTKHNCFSAGGWLPVGERYEAFLIFTKNTSKQQENGGLKTPAQFAEGQVQSAIDLDIWLRDQKALTRHANWDLQLVQHLKILGNAKKDSLGREIEATNKRALRLTHVFNLGQEYFKFADAGLNTDGPFFNAFLVDDRGLRNYIAVKKYENTATLTTFKPTGQGKRSDFLAAGITHTFFKLNQEPQSSSFSNVFAFGTIGYTPSERLNVTARGDLGLFKNIGEYQINGKLKLGLGKLGELRGNLLSQRYPPTLLQEHLNISKRIFWTNDFKKPVQNVLSATYALPKIGFEATALTHLVNNHIYYDAQGVPQQIGSPLQVAQLLLRENFRIKHLHLDNTVALQKVNNTTVLHLPEWFSKNSLYYSGRVFKKNMLLETGVDFRMNSAFLPDNYQPLTWQFHLQDTFSQKPYPWLDAFVAFKVSNFRVYARFENLSWFWDKQSALMLTNRYAQPLFNFRLGIRWRFMDSNLSENGGQDQAPPGVGGGSGPPRF